MTMRIALFDIILPSKAFSAIPVSHGSYAVDYCTLILDNSCKTGSSLVYATILQDQCVSLGPNRLHIHHSNKQ